MSAPHLPLIVVQHPALLDAAALTELTKASIAPPKPPKPLTVIDILNTVGILKQAGVKKPKNYVIIPPELESAVTAALDKPRQEPLFIIPPPATPCAWAIEWRWRDGAKGWDGKPKDTAWSSVYSIYRDWSRVKRALRQARYSDSGKRKNFRVRVVKYDFHGDITFEGPPEPKNGTSPQKDPAEASYKPIWI